MLARQLEYYFSEQNLATDTYLRTLRELNDGCVPVTILANFSKVKAILTPHVLFEHTKSVARVLQEEELRMHSILQAVNEYYTDLLMVHSIDTATGTIANDDTPSSAITILAVGPNRDSPSGTPRPLPTVPESMQRQQPQQSAAESNTLILRDVGSAVTEMEVRGLLVEIEGCPPVVSVVADVGNCWYVASLKSVEDEL